VLKIETHLTAVPAFAASAASAVAPYAGNAATQACSAPMAAVQGTTVSAAGRIDALLRNKVAFGFTADVTADPGSPPREAPV